MSREPLFADDSVGALTDEKLPEIYYKEGEPLRDLTKYLIDGEGQYVEVRSAHRLCC